METAAINAHFDKIEVNDQSLIYCSDGSGEIVDISMKGLSFRHLTGNDWPQGAFKIDLLLENSTLLIEQIPCSFVDIKPTSPNETSNLPYNLEFGPLSPDQTEKLQEFISTKQELRASLSIA